MHTPTMRLEYTGKVDLAQNVNARVTAKNLRVMKVDTDENLLLVFGSVPGPVGTYCMIRKARKAK